jgi:FkbM family methyltransferase
MSTTVLILRRQKFVISIPSHCALLLMAQRCQLTHDSYGLRKIRFAASDVVADVGGHIGLFSIYLGLRFPTLIIHSFEPFPDNYDLFRSNLALNPVANVHLHHLALSSDGRSLEMVTNPANSGGATCNSTTLRPSGTSGTCRYWSQASGSRTPRACRAENGVRRMAGAQIRSRCHDR